MVGLGLNQPRRRCARVFLCGQNGPKQETGRWSLVEAEVLLLSKLSLPFLLQKERLEKFSFVSVDTM